MPRPMDEITGEMRDALEQCSDVMTRIMNMRVRDEQEKTLYHPLETTPWTKPREGLLVRLDWPEYNPENPQHAPVVQIMMAEHRAREILREYDAALKGEDYGRG